jgi:hypothetical protein
MNGQPRYDPLSPVDRGKVDAREMENLVEHTVNVVIERLRGTQETFDHDIRDALKQTFVQGFSKLAQAIPRAAAVVDYETMNEHIRSTFSSMPRTHWTVVTPGSRVVDWVTDATMEEGIFRVTSAFTGTHLSRRAAQQAFLNVLAMAMTVIAEIPRGQAITGQSYETAGRPPRPRRGLPAIPSTFPATVPLPPSLPPPPPPKPAHIRQLDAFFGFESGAESDDDYRGPTFS